MALDSDIDTRSALWMLSRRRFLQGLGASGVGLAAASLWPFDEAFAGNPIGPNDGVLVVVTLAGGNDGHNTVVPAADGFYYDRRQGLALNPETLLQIGGGYGLHPSLGYLKSLYDDGQVALIEGVGVTANASLSHFDSMATWMRGASTVGGVPSGWIGRWLDALAAPPITAVNIGSDVPLTLVGTERAGAAVPTWSHSYGDVEGVHDRQFNDAVRSLGAGGFGGWADAIVASQVEALDVAYDTNPLHEPRLPDGPFLKDLTLAARLINANVGTRVLSVIHGDFDHHSDQLNDHAALLAQVDTGLQGFFATLTAENARRTAVMIVSEFGRTPEVNGGRGTDHGTANTVMLIGPRVAGGRTGAPSSFTDLDRDGRFKPTVDFRQVYATVLDSWLAADSRSLLAGSFSPLRLFKSAPTTLPIPPEPPTPPGGFVPITPERRLDTRIGLGAARARILGGSALPVQIGGLGNVPNTDVTSVVLNVTVTEPTLPGFVTVWPTGEPRPWASHLNFTAGQTVPNLVLAKLGNGGMVSLFPNAGQLHMVADVVGYFSLRGGSALVPMTPVRLLDTRLTGQKVGAGGVVDLPIAGTYGVPASGVSGVVLNVTVTEPTQPGFVTVWPSGEPMPVASSLNFIRGQTVPNLVMSKVAENGRVSFYNLTGQSHLVIDLMGYFTTGEGGSKSVAANPVRLLDTRGGSPLGSGETMLLTVAGNGAPAEATAAVLNVTVTEPSASGFLTVWPNGQGRPTASNLNFVAGQTVPNQVIATIGAGGQIAIFNSVGNTHVIADLMGWYV